MKWEIYGQLFRPGEILADRQWAVVSSLCSKLAKRTRL